MAESKTNCNQIQKTWRHAIAATERLLTLADVWPIEEKKQFRTLKVAFYFFLAILFDIFNLIELRNLLNKQDYELLSNHLSTCGLYIGYLIKIIIFMSKRDAFKRMLNIMDSPILDDYPSELQKHKKNCLSISNGIATWYMTFVGACIFLYLNKPLYTDYALPISFSYDLSLITHGLMLALQCFSCYYLVMVGICFDMLTIGSMNVAKAQLDILSGKLISFKPKNTKSLEEGERAFLIKCIEHHQTIIRFVSETEDVFSFIFLTQCLASVTSICNAAFQLTHTKNVISINFIFNCAFAFNVLFEVGICCWFGSLLTIKSLEVSDACFKFNWLSSSKLIRKMLLLMMVRSQKPLFISIGKFARLSMSSYLMMLKTAYSYFALMQSLFDKENN